MRDEIFKFHPSFLLPDFLLEFKEMEIVNERNLLQFFISIFPDFKTTWNSEKNHFGDDDGFTAHGVCAEFSHYFIENYKEFFNEQLKTLFNKIEYLIVDSEPKGEIENALCTCFLENIAQTESGEFAKQFMGKRSAKFFDYWN